MSKTIEHTSASGIRTVVSTAFVAERMQWVACDLSDLASLLARCGLNLESRAADEARTKLAVMADTLDADAGNRVREQRENWHNERRSY